MPRLRRVDCSGPGIARRRRGRGFEYLDAEGGRVVDDDVLERVRALVVPPAWEDVWICPHANGHIQAVGTDAAGRRQYLYHADWRLRRDREKFDEMLLFARALPRVREVAARHLRKRGLPRERVLAGALRLLDRGFFRIGTEDYAEENGTFGIATMRRSHVRLGPGGLIRFDYPAKGGKRRVQSVVDRDVYRVVEALKRRRGSGELLAYRNGRRWVDVTSDDINAYLKDVAGGDFSAKDFRTWNATVLAAVALAVSGEAHGSPAARKRAVSRAVGEVAHYLGNTPAVCRASYVDPRVFDRFDGGLTIGGALERLGEVSYGEPATQGAVEEAVLDLLERDLDSPALERVPGRRATRPGGRRGRRP
jgi:DNA topoisomerase-1